MDDEEILTVVIQDANGTEIGNHLHILEDRLVLMLVKGGETYGVQLKRESRGQLMEDFIKNIDTILEI